MTIAVRRLSEGARAALSAHFLALPLEDQCLRFGTSLAPGAIVAYVDGIDFGRDAVFGVHDDSLALTGVAHVAFKDNLAELGISVLPAHRGRGVGGVLFKRAADHARNRCMPRLLMQCLSGNVPIMRIARRFDMDLVMRGGEVRAHLDLPPASLASMAGERFIDAFAFCDRTFKALLAAWTHQPRSESGL